MIRTRFPPEPNGFLHLGHLKSIYYNFGYPFDKDKTKEKETYLRFDDTNPKTEKQEYVDSIKENLKWLGYHPDRVSYTSDYFEEIAEFTRKLINDGHVFLDYSTPEEIKEERKEKKFSKYRETSPKKTLEVFNRILYQNDPNNPILRLKIPLKDRTNDCMNDPIIYRMIQEPHYRTGTKYKAYPTYEYSHYIVDSLEGITHSFCTLEFYVRRPLSFWILDKLNLPRMVIEETNRLKTDFGFLSKRKIKGLLDKGDLDGWDDPRLLTISALRRKGLTPEILKEFCAQQGYTKNMNAVTTLKSFEAVIRNNLNLKAKRRMGVLDPIKVNLTNFHEIRYFNKPVYPNRENEDQVVMTCLCPSVYIERDDFRLEANKKYKRWTPKKVVRLKYAGILKYLSHQVDEKGQITEIDAEFLSENENKEKINGTIHWVSYPSEKELNQCQTKLITWTYPESNDLNDSGTKKEKKIMLDYLYNEIETGNWQFERLGYYHVTDNKEVHSLVSLKEDKNKND